MMYRWIVRFAVAAALLLVFPLVGRLGAVAAAPAQQAVAVEAGDNFFEPRNLTVRAGTTVRWANTGQRPHTVTADTGAFDSGNLDPGANFSFTFNSAGTYPYFCEYHGTRGGQGMAGTITVTAAQAAAPAQPAAQPAAPAQPEAQPAAPSSTLPATGTSGSGGAAIVALALIAAALGLALRLRAKRSVA